MISVSICIGSSCHLRGSYDVISELKRLIAAHHLGGHVEINACFCLGHCSDAVSVRINDDPVEGVRPEKVSEFFNRRIMPLTKDGTAGDIAS